MPPRSLRLRALPLAALLAAAVACATNPVTGKREFMLMSEAQEIAIGREYDAQVRQEMGLYQDDALQRYVSEIGLQLARDSHRPDLPWSFAVVDAPAVNAFALPGGFIYLTRGILPYLQNEADLAGVLGHEIGHVTARHSAQQYTKATGGGLGLLTLGIFVPAARPFGQLAETALGLLFLKHGRDDELQADRLGVEYNAQQGWDPRGVQSMLTTLARISEAADRRGVPNWLSTHPEPEDRVERVQEAIAAASKSRTGWETNRDAFLRRIDGIVVGDNPEEGVVRDNVFLHPVLRFELRFPELWEISNGKQQVVAKAPGKEQYLILQLVEQPQGRTLDEVARRNMQQAGFRLSDGGLTRINGLDAHVGLYQGSMQGLGQVVARAAHIQLGQRIFLLVGLAPTASWSEINDSTQRSVQSFRELTRDEAANVRPNVLDFYTVREGDSWQSIAARASRNVVSATTLAIMNGYPVNEQPRPGERIKIVVEG